MPPACRPSPVRSAAPSSAPATRSTTWHAGSGTPASTSIPALIARCTGLADVIAAVRFARENRLLVAIRGGGHNVGGRALCDGGMVIDLSRHEGHSRRSGGAARSRPAGRPARRARSRNPRLRHGRAGSASSRRPAIAGLTLGGGVGWLARKYGLTCDNVISFELVTADGEVRRASADEHPDLFWALRGGGGNFGVVTSFEYRLRPVSDGARRTARPSARPCGRAPAASIVDFTQSRAGRAGGLRRPAAHARRRVRSRPSSRLLQRRPRPRASGLLAPLRAFGPPLADAIQPMPFPVMQTLFDGAVPDGNQNYWKSSFLRELSDEAIATIVEPRQRGDVAADRGARRAVRRRRQPRRDRPTRRSRSATRSTTSAS